MANYKYVRVTGLDVLKTKLARIPNEMKTQGVAAYALFAAAKQVKQSVIDRAPVYSGQLQENIIAYRDRSPAAHGANARYSILVRKIKLSKKVKRLLRRVRAAGAHITIKQDPYYWRFVEYGTSRIPAQGFFHKGIAAAEPQLVGLVNEKLAKKLDAIIKKIGSK